MRHACTRLRDRRILIVQASSPSGRARSPYRGSPDGYYRAGLELRGVPLEHLGHQHAALLGGDVREAHEPCVRAALDENDVPEVRIYRHKHASVSLGVLEESPVAWIWPERTRLDDIMPSTAKPLGEAATGTPIDQELQRPTARTISI